MKLTDDQRETLNARIREIFLANGFRIKEGLTDLKPYVYQAAYALLWATGYFDAHPDHSGDGGDEREAARRLIQRHANAARALEHMYTEKNVTRLKLIGEELEAALTQKASPVADAPVISREFIGQIVREAWIKWAKQQPNPKSSWLAPYDELSEADKEADRQIGDAVLQWALRLKDVRYEAISIASAEEAAQPDRCYAPSCGMWDGTDTCTCQRTANTLTPKVLGVLTNVAGILDVIKQEWSATNSWSDYDQSVRNGITELLGEHYGYRAETIKEMLPTHPAAAQPSRAEVLETHELPPLHGVSRIADNPCALMLLLKREPTDDDLREIHDVLAGREVKS